MAEKGENTLHEAFIGWAILLFFFAVLIAIFWYFFDTEMRDLLRWWRYGQMQIVALFASDDYVISMGSREFNFMQGFENTPNYEAEKLTYNHMSYFTALAMQPLRIPIAVILLLGAVWCIFRGPRTQYRVTLGLDGLIHRQSKIFPAISPFVDFNPSTQPVRPPGAPVPAELPSFAEALGPEEWLAYFKNPLTDGKVDRDAATKEFSRQLQGRWKGVRKLKPYQQILVAAFCLKASRKRNESDHMLGRLAQCWSFKNGLELRKDRKLLKDARAVLANKDLSASTLAKCNKHAFVTTAILRALLNAREEGGVLAPSQFVWLRGYDRALWYPLNNLGRQSFHTEALGAMSHFKIERRTDRPIPVPKVEDAVNTITDYMNSSEARAVPELDYSKSKKRGVKKAA